MMLIAILSLLCLILVLVLLFFLLHRFDQERKDMLDRLMSRDITEYKRHAEPVPVSDPVSLDDEEEWAREIEMMKNGSG